MKNEIREIELLLDIDEDIVATVKNIEKAKKELEITIDSLNDVILLIDSKGKIIRGNRAVKAWNLEEVTNVENLFFHNLFHPECSDNKCHLVSYWILAKEKIQKNQSFEYQMMDTVLNCFLLIQYIPVSSPRSQNKNEFAVAYFKDISRQKQTEIDLIRTTTEFNTIFQAIPDQYYRVNKDGEILDLKINKVESEIFTFPIFPGTKIYQNLDPDFKNIFKNSIKKVLDEKKLVNVEYHFIPKDTKYFFEARFLPLKKDQIIVINRNITEKKKLMTIAESVNMMDNLGFVFSGIRHEIGNPINAVKMTISVLRKNIERYSNDKIIEYTDRVLSEINRIEYLLNSFKSFNMYENLNFVCIDISEFFKKLLKLIKENLDNKGININIDVSPDTGPVYGDPRALHQVFLNIIGNAIDAVNSSFDPEINIITKKVDGSVQIVVKDNGIGMDREQAGNLFKPFATTKQKGSGLGLVIVQKLLSSLNGHIEFESIKGVGTTFSIFLPGGESE